MKCHCPPPWYRALHTPIAKVAGGSASDAFGCVFSESEDEDKLVQCAVKAGDDGRWSEEDERHPLQQRPFHGIARNGRDPQVPRIPPASLPAKQKRMTQKCCVLTIVGIFFPNSSLPFR